MLLAMRLASSRGQSGSALAPNAPPLLTTGIGVKLGAITAINVLATGIGVKLADTAVGHILKTGVSGGTVEGTTGRRG
jgi:hypothetical protein